MPAIEAGHTLSRGCPTFYSPVRVGPLWGVPRGEPPLSVWSREGDVATDQGGDGIRSSLISRV
jgi:hypothetical protein